MIKFEQLDIGDMFKFLDGDGMIFLKTNIKKQCCGGRRWNSVSSDNKRQQLVEDNMEVEKIEQ